MSDAHIAMHNFLVPAGRGVSFPCGFSGGTELDIRVAYHIDGLVPEKGLACTFEFERALASEELAGTGIYHSESIGPFAYVTTPDPDGRRRLRVRVPAGSTLRSIGLRRWDAAGDTLVRSLSVDQLSPDDDALPAHLRAKPAILVFTNLGVNTIDGSSIFISNWLNMFCLMDADVHFLSTIEPGDHFKGRLTSPTSIAFHRCDADAVVPAIAALDARHDFRNIFIRSWGSRLLWFSPEYAPKVRFYWPLTNEPTDEDRMVFDAVGGVVFQTDDLRAATFEVLGAKDSVLMQPLLIDFEIPRLPLRFVPPAPGIRLTFGYVGTLRPECYSADLLRAMLDVLNTYEDVFFYLVIGKIHYADHAAKVEVQAQVKELKQHPRASVHERLDKTVCDALLTRCDVTFSLWERTPANELQVSTKLLESLRLGCQVVTFDTARHRKLLGDDYPGLIDEIDDLPAAVRALVESEAPLRRFVDGHMLSQFSIERQARTIADYAGVALARPDVHMRNLFHKQYDRIYGVYIDRAEALKLDYLGRRHGIDIELFPGTLGKVELVEEFAAYQELGLRTDWEKNAKRQRLTIGAMGHLYTFIRIARDALERGYRKILILEADVVLHRDFFVRHASQDLEDYKLLYLGAGMWNSGVEYLADRPFYRPAETTGTFAVALDRSILEECIELWSAILDPTDVALWRIQERYPDECYVSFPNLAICDLTQSNTTHKRDQAKLSERFRWNLPEYDIATAEHVERYVERIRIGIAHREAEPRIQLVCASGVREVAVPTDGGVIDQRVDDYLHYIELTDVFIDELTFHEV